MSAGLYSILSPDSGSARNSESRTAAPSEKH
eukprot:COSAG04_NODE_22215_length_359_cov_0.411538_1_plen_30_part_01